jgi:hypothetical protein
VEDFGYPMVEVEFMEKVPMVDKYVEIADEQRKEDLVFAKK